MTLSISLSIPLFPSGRRLALAGAWTWVGVLVATWLTVGCASVPSPQIEPGYPKTPERVLVFVPGILGSKLEAADGTSIWGSGLDVLLPRDGGYEMALPILERGQDDVRATGIVEAVPLGPFYRRDVYNRLFDWLVVRGYRVGDLERPDRRADASIFGFGYDFRRSNSDAVEVLRERLLALQAARGEGPLEFDLLCQSNGAYICRLLVARESRRGGGRPRLIPRRVALVGNANGGGLRTLRELRDGRTYVPTMGIGRQFQPEVIFSFESVFLDLPHADAIWPRGEQAIFFDATGDPLEVDLYDPAAWQRYGWSAFSEDARRRLARPRAEPIFGDENDRVEYLRERLEQAIETQRELRRGPDPFAVPPELLSIQARHIPTIDAAVLPTDGGVDTTVFHGDREERSLPESVQRLLVSDGDEHATVASQSWMSAREISWLVGDPMIVEGGHFDLILLPGVLDRLAEFFLEPWSAHREQAAEAGSPEVR